ncbi:chaperone protein HtpG [Plesiocystis pacifica SIR-1]|uniref:Chaperone protein HtpG n=1 Tax=Plesiocystis pacifica SIR-1 TaxID=391625 RepID=A6FY38_9BACT|nr:ATP-binding protein [Plesiocystis pacifica]EDM81417.1 chaperone protein HtpG [Plesiocystis pacifica SIR-1]
MAKRDKDKAGGEAINVGQALDNLVHQFSDPWSFLRELIQNAIDAGSSEIDVHIEHQPPDDPSGDDPGLMVIEIVDTGEGMDRDIIDTRLTRLFSSAKDGDYTKIGRFGIGFVSVFAIEPDVVCVDTGRAGEYWRVLFKGDRSFERISLDMPVEGTTIRIYKHADADAVEDARRRAGRVLEYWCKHAKVEIRLDGRQISRPMALGDRAKGARARCVIRHEEEGTRVLLGLSPKTQALRGYYHGGLTLHEERESEDSELDAALAHLTFKIDSRFLEHTLTRDNVIRDENYAKAMGIVLDLARGPLLVALFDAIEAHTRAQDEARSSGGLVPPRDAELDAHLRRALYRVAKGDLELPKGLGARPILPTLDGPPCSLDEVRKVHRGRRTKVWVGAEASPVTRALRERGDLVLRAEPDTALRFALERHLDEALPTTQELCTALELDPQSPAAQVERPRWQALRAALTHLLGVQGLRVSALHLGHLDYPGSPVAERVAITQGSFGELTPTAEVGELGSGWLTSKRCVVLNADHGTVAHLLELAGAEPELAAYLLLKLFYLHGAEGEGLDSTLDSTLATAAAEARWQRSTP